MNSTICAHFSLPLPAGWHFRASPALGATILLATLSSGLGCARDSEAGFLATQQGRTHPSLAASPGPYRTWQQTWDPCLDPAQSKGCFQSRVVWPRDLQKTRTRVGTSLAGKTRESWAGVPRRGVARELGTCVEQVLPAAAKPLSTVNEKARWRSPESGKSEGGSRQLRPQDPRRAEATVQRKEYIYICVWPSNGDFSPGLVPKIRGHKRAEVPAGQRSLWQGTRLAFQVGPTQNIARVGESKGQKATLSWDEDNRTQAPLRTRRRAGTGAGWGGGKSCN